MKPRKLNVKPTYALYTNTQIKERKANPFKNTHIHQKAFVVRLTNYLLETHRSKEQKLLPSAQEMRTSLKWRRYMNNRAS